MIARLTTRCGCTRTLKIPIRLPVIEVPLDTILDGKYDPMITECRKFRFLKDSSRQDADVEYVEICDE